MQLNTHDPVVIETDLHSADLVDSANAILRDAIDAHPGKVALVSSFGAESIVLLHLMADIDPSVPVIFIDTGRHFPETLAYVDTIERQFGLTDLRRVGPAAAEVARLDPDSIRAGYDPDGCCDFRKTVPLAGALEPFEAWISGRKRFQGPTRTELPTIEIEDGKTKYNPLAAWTAADIGAYRRKHGLPQHPLVAKGYLSIGCAPCTTIVKPGEDARAGRWRGFDKTECGIHLPGEMQDGLGI
jgi:phosphoadenosine phosphosulfate reductase